ncbi:hypothetical protein [Burkholderia phage FLC9]|nr:hypothetical protein [Burkholderia phage FLC9]
MGVRLSLINFNELFYQHQTRDPKIINDIAESSEQDRKEFNRLIYTTYSGDLLSNLPSCECGEIVGGYNVGVVCGVCGTEVRSHVERDLEPIVWIRRPKGVAALINPIVWMMLKKRFTRSGYEIIRWICDTNYAPPVRKPQVVYRLEEMNCPRGLNNFVEKFDQIMAMLMDLKEYRKSAEHLELMAAINQQRDCVFSEYLPLPNRALLVIEESNVGTYVDPIITGAVDAIRMMAGIDSSLTSHTVRVKENRTVKTISQLAEFYEGLYKTTLAKKQGIFRKHVFGSRSHFSFRAVISSLTDAHDNEEIHIPWGIGLSVFRIHLMNKLMRRGFTPNEGIAFLNKHASIYNELLDQLFQELIVESPLSTSNGVKGIPTIMQRNPSLERGSAQLVYITKVKTVVEIPTVSISILDVKGLNADFDGDQLNFTPCLDTHTTQELRGLAPFMSAFGLDSPRKVSSNLAQPKPVIATTANFVHDTDLEFDQVKLQRMMALAEPA